MTYTYSVRQRIQRSPSGTDIEHIQGMLTSVQNEVLKLLLIISAHVHVHPKTCYFCAMLISSLLTINFSAMTILILNMCRVPGYRLWTNYRTRLHNNLISMRRRCRPRLILWAAGGPAPARPTLPCPAPYLPCRSLLTWSKHVFKPYLTAYLVSLFLSLST